MSCEPAELNSVETLIPWLRLMVPGLQDSDARLLLCSSMRTFFEDSQIWRDDDLVLQVNTTSLEYLIPPPADTYIDEIIDVYQSAGDGKEYKINRRTERRSNGDQWWVSEEPHKVTFNNTFERVQPLRLKIALVPTGKTAPALLLRQWEEPIRELARYHAATMPGKEWTDRRQAQSSMLLYEQAKNAALRSHKISTNSNRAPLTSRQMYRRMANGD